MRSINFSKSWMLCTKRRSGQILLPHFHYFFKIWICHFAAVCFLNRKETVELKETKKRIKNLGRIAFFAAWHFTYYLKMYTTQTDNNFIFARGKLSRLNSTPQQGSSVFAVNSIPVRIGCLNSPLTRDILCIKQKHTAIRKHISQRKAIL